MYRIHHSVYSVLYTIYNIQYTAYSIQYIVYSHKALPKYTQQSSSLSSSVPRRVKVLYDYEAQDLDEITIKEGQMVDLVKEGGTAGT